MFIDKLYAFSSSEIYRIICMNIHISLFIHKTTQGAAHPLKFSDIVWVKRRYAKRKRRGRALWRISLAFDSQLLSLWQGRSAWPRSRQALCQSNWGRCLIRATKDIASRVSVIEEVSHHQGQTRARACDHVTGGVKRIGGVRECLTTRNPYLLAWTLKQHANSPLKTRRQHRETIHILSLSRRSFLSGNARENEASSGRLLTKSRLQGHVLVPIQAGQRPGDELKVKRDGVAFSHYHFNFFFFVNNKTIKYLSCSFPCLKKVRFDQ